MHINSMDTIILNNGVTMPRIGFGVFRMDDSEECERAVVQAIHTGYRLIDTAAAYENEEAVGRAIRHCDISREELFITTKLWITDTCYEKAKDGFYRSLNRLGLDYVDLYLIHQPFHDYYGAWRAMEELYEEGKIRAIGVDNFTQDKLADLIFWNKIKPAVNMIECHPLFQRNDEYEYLVSQGIQMQAWSPLAAGKTELFENEQLRRIAETHKKSVPQIILRWQIQRGIVPLVKSANPKRMAENLDLFDFSLSEDEMQCIAKLDTGRSCFPQRTTGKMVTESLRMAQEFRV